MSISIPKLDTPGVENPGPETLTGVRLAVLVVYHFDDFLQGLVAVHLDHLRRYTPPGTVIFGAAIRLARAQHNWLSAQPDVHLPELGTLPHGYREEHNGALDRLAKIAFHEGATHVATMHQDSFPVRADWLARLTTDLDAITPFAVAERRAYNCCMVWDESWQAHGPTMLPGDALRDQAMPKLMAERPDLDFSDGGIGHLLLAHSLGLGWRALRHTAPDILDGRILHLTGSSRIAHAERIPRRDTNLATKLRSLARPMLPHIPKRLRKSLGRAVGVHSVQTPEVSIGRDGSAQDKRDQVSRLVADPDAYVAQALCEPLLPGARWANQRASQT